MKPDPKLLLAAALLLVALGVGLALLQPGNLGDDGDRQTAQPAVTETETETDVETETETSTDVETETENNGSSGGTDGEGEGATTTAPTPTTTATTAGSVDGGDPPPTSVAGASSTTVPPTATTATTPPSGGVENDGDGTGVAGDSDVAPADTKDGLADTGGTSALAAVLALALVGLALRVRTA